jgi:hypothetical protein
VVGGKKLTYIKIVKLVYRRATHDDLRKFTIYRGILYGLKTLQSKRHRDNRNTCQICFPEIRAVFDIITRYTGEAERAKK